MAHLEQERYAPMLRETFSLQRQLLAVDVEVVHAEVELGALLVTTIGCFTLPLDGEIDSEPSCWVMSPSAPPAEELEGLEVGDRFRFVGSGQRFSRFTKCALAFRGPDLGLSLIEDSPLNSRRERWMDLRFC